MSYTLILTEDDIETIAFVGHRYCWSDQLLSIGVEAGENTISEPDAWLFSEAMDADMDGGHSGFPMLDPRSELIDKLIQFWQDIV